MMTTHLYMFNPTKVTQKLTKILEIPQIELNPVKNFNTCIQLAKSFHLYFILLAGFIHGVCVTPHQPVSYKNGVSSILILQFMTKQINLNVTWQPWTFHWAVNILLNAISLWPSNCPHHLKNVKTEKAIELQSASQFFFVSGGNLAYSRNEQEKKTMTIVNLPWDGWCHIGIKYSITMTEIIKDVTVAHKLV